MRLSAYAGLLLALLAPTAARAAVVINEIFYNAPGDNDDVQWIELHNTAAQAVDVGGGALDQGRTLTFSGGAKIAAKGYLVVALNPEQFTKAYGSDVLGPMKRPLKRSGEKIDLRSADGSVADVARYKDKSPWPAGADGHSASLERICPTAPGDVATNWASSPLPASPRPGGTPGEQNANYSAVMPPVVSVADTPAVVAPGKPLTVKAQVTGDVPLREIALLYRVITVKSEGAEVSVPMAKGDGDAYVANIPAQVAGSLLRYRVRAGTESGAPRFEPPENDLRPTFTTYVHAPFEPAPIGVARVILGRADRSPARPQNQGRPQRFRGRPGGFDQDAEAQPRAPRGTAAFIYVDPETGAAEVFDYINAVPRGRRPGLKLFFHKDRPFHDMTALSLVFEGSERSLLAEALSYDVYRRAGNAAPLTEFVHLWIDGKDNGHHLIVERPNRGFLRRNHVDDTGNLYKARWFGDGIVGQNVKKTHAAGGHGDMLDVIDLMEKSSNDPEAQWAVIHEHFDVEQIATHFAVNMVLDHWDGFFNNFYAYHDTARGKWQMYPWDHDQAWGITGGWDAMPLVSIPLTFGMNGAAGGRAGDGPFDRGGPGWWRPPGYFSGPLLANAQFRRVFLSRVRDVVDKVYTEERYVPMIDDLVRRLAQDA